MRDRRIFPACFLFPAALLHTAQAFPSGNPVISFAVKHGIPKYLGRDHIFPWPEKRSNFHFIIKPDLPIPLARADLRQPPIHIKLIPRIRRYPYPAAFHRFRHDKFLTEACKPAFILIHFSHPGTHIQFDKGILNSIYSPSSAFLPCSPHTPHRKPFLYNNSLPLHCADGNSFYKIFLKKGYSTIIGRIPTTEIAILMLTEGICVFTVPAACVSVLELKNWTSCKIRFRRFCRL